MCWFGDLWCFHAEDWNFNQWLLTVGLFFRALAFILLARVNVLIWWFIVLSKFHAEDWNFNQWLPTIGLFFRTLAFSSIWKMCSSPHMFISANISVSLQCIPPYIFPLVPKLEFDAFLCTDQYSRQQRACVCALPSIFAACFMKYLTFAGHSSQDQLIEPSSAYIPITKNWDIGRWSGSYAKCCSSFEPLSASQRDFHPSGLITTLNSKSMHLCTAVNLCHMFHEILDLCKSFFTRQVNWTIVGPFSNDKTWSRFSFIGKSGIVYGYPM